MPRKSHSRRITYAETAGEIVYILTVVECTPSRSASGTRISRSGDACTSRIAAGNRTLLPASAIGSIISLAFGKRRLPTTALPGRLESGGSWNVASNGPRFCKLPTSRSPPFDCRAHSIGSGRGRAMFPSLPQRTTRNRPLLQRRSLRTTKPRSPPPTWARAGSFAFGFRWLATTTPISKARSNARSPNWPARRVATTVAPRSSSNSFRNAGTPATAKAPISRAPSHWPTISRVPRCRPLRRSPTFRARSKATACSSPWRAKKSS